MTTALEEANERSEHERANQRTRFEALQARAGASEKLLAEAREHLLARAEVRDCDRRLSTLAIERDGLQARISDLEAERVSRESELRETSQAQSTLMERSAALARAFTAEEAALERAEATIFAGPRARQCHY